MKIRLEWKTDPNHPLLVDDDWIGDKTVELGWQCRGRQSREYATLSAKDIRRLCRDVSANGEPYLIEVIHSDPVVPPDQSIKTWTSGPLPGAVGDAGDHG